MDFYFEKVLPFRKFPRASQEAALAQLARLKGTLVHLLTYDHDNDDDEEDCDEEDKDDDDEDEDEDEVKDKDENTGAQKGFEGTWSTYSLATCLTP